MTEEEKREGFVAHLAFERDYYKKRVDAVVALVASGNMMALDGALYEPAGKVRVSSVALGLLNTGASLTELLAEAKRAGMSSSRDFNCTLPETNLLQHALRIAWCDIVLRLESLMEVDNE